GERHPGLFARQPAGLFEGRVHGARGGWSAKGRPAMAGRPSSGRYGSARAFTGAPPGRWAGEGSCSVDGGAAHRLAGEVEVVLELDRVRQAQHDRHPRLLDVELVEGEGGRG